MPRHICEHLSWYLGVGLIVECCVSGASFVLSTCVIGFVVDNNVTHAAETYKKRLASEGILGCVKMVVIHRVVVLCVSVWCTCSTSDR